MNRGLSDCRTYKVSAEYRDDMMVQSVGADGHVSADMIMRSVGVRDNIYEFYAKISFYPLPMPSLCIHRYN
jgi:hypothetical protein